MIRQFVTALIFSGLMPVAANAAELPGSSTQYCQFADNPVQAQPELPQELQRFLGIFDGKWEGQMPHTLIVEDVSPEGTVSGYYAYSPHAAWNIRNAGCQRIGGVIRNGELTATLPSTAHISYRFDGDGNLQGTYVRGSSRVTGTFSQVYPPHDPYRHR